MLKIGLTGGIGSGKTTIAKAFHDSGYPVYIADTEASRLMNHAPEIRKALTALFGESIYRPDRTLDKQQLASLIFHDAALLRQVNGIVHPAVMQDFLEWCGKQQASLVFFESAILFEAGLNSCFDAVICVTADLPTRIERVMKRDGVSAEKVNERIRNQAGNDEKSHRADFVVDTTDGKDWRRQITTLIDILIRKH